MKKKNKHWPPFVYKKSQTKRIKNGDTFYSLAVKLFIGEIVEKTLPPHTLTDPK